MTRAPVSRLTFGEWSAPRAATSVEAALWSNRKRVVFALVVGVLSASAHAADLVPLPAQSPVMPWPTEAWPSGWPGANVDGDRLTALMEHAFESPAPEDLPH